MQLLQRIDWLTVTAALVIAALAALAVWGWRVWRRRRSVRRMIAAVVAAGFDHLRGVLVPDGNGGSFHVDFLLLTARGILVIDLRDIAGNVFGGDQMNEWTVMNGPQRSTFANPQGALYDRVAAVKAIAGDVPVEGRILFTRRARFPKGLPKWTLMIDALRAEFPASDREAFADVLARSQGAWELLKGTVVPSRLDSRLR